MNAPILTMSKDLLTSPWDWVLKNLPFLSLSLHGPFFAVPT